MLDVRHREVEHRWHERKLAATLFAIEQQFRPDVRKPLDIPEVLALCEAEARPYAANDFAMLAILHAWLGHDRRALECCERIQDCPMPTLAPVPERQQALRLFGRDLAEAIRTRTGRALLEASIGAPGQ
jgi:hypothetical protein